MSLASAKEPSISAVLDQMGGILWELLLRDSPVCAQSKVGLSLVQLLEFGFHVPSIHNKVDLNSAIVLC